MGGEYIGELSHLEIDCNVLAGAHERGYKPSREGALHVVVRQVQVQGNLLVVVDGWA